jgi:hypothetical protein
MPLRWGVPPPAKPLSGSVRLLCIKAGQKFNCCALGPMVGLQTHWIGKTVPCLGDDCRHCDSPQTWKGYIPVVVDGWCSQGPAKGAFRWVLVVTEEIGQQCLTWPRGTVAMVARPGRKNNGPLTFSVRADCCTPNDLPDCFDVKPYVLRASGFSYSAASMVRLAT